MLVVGYIRVSRVGGRRGESFISPTVQRDRIATWAQAHRHSVVDLIEDLDRPGSRADRPGLVRAMELVESGQAKGIVVAKLDRFGRSVAHLARLLERLREADGALFAVNEGIDTRGATGKLVADILGAIAEWELGRIRDNWSTARIAAANRGVYIAEAPVGFDKTNGRLRPNEWASAVAEAFRRRVSGDSWVTIARALDAEGVPGRRGGGWTVSAVRRLIANRAYLGEAPDGSGGGVRGAHESVIDLQTFEAANAAKGVAPQRTGTSSALLAGVLRCAGCRYAMKLSQGRSRHGKPLREYRCKGSRREAAGVCPAPTSVKATVIEPFVLDAFWRFIGDYEMAGFNPDAPVEEAAHEVRQAEVELDAALDRRLSEALGGDDSDAYIAMVTERRAALDVARGALADAQREAASAALPGLELREQWPDLTLYEQRKLLASVLDAVFVRRTPNAGGQVPIDSRVYFAWHGEAPELPVRGRRWTPQPFDFPGAAEAGV